MSVENENRRKLKDKFAVSVISGIFRKLGMPHAIISRISGHLHILGNKNPDI